MAEPQQAATTQPVTAIADSGSGLQTAVDPAPAADRGRLIAPADIASPHDMRDVETSPDGMTIPLTVQLKMATWGPDQRMVW